MKQNGSVIMPDESGYEEGDIVDHKATIMEDDTPLPSSSSYTAPVRVGPKENVFTLRLQSDHKQWGTNQGYYASTSKWESWKKRAEEAGENEPLVIKDDAIY